MLGIDIVYDIMSEYDCALEEAEELFYRMYGNNLFENVMLEVD